MKRNRTIPGQLSIFDNQPEPQPTEPEPIALPAPESHFEIVVVPFRRRTLKPEQTQTIDLECKTIRELKAIASRLRMPRYNVCTKSQLIQRLTSEFEPDRLLKAIAA